VQIILLLLLFALCAPSACADIAVDLFDSYASPTTATRQYPFEVAAPDAKLGINSTAIFTSGSGSLRVLDPSGAEIYKHLWGTTRSQERTPLPIAASGNYTLEISADAALGGWRVRVRELPARNSLRAMYFLSYSLFLMAAVLIIAAKRAGAPMTTLGAGAAMFLLSSFLALVGGVVLQLALFARLEFAVSHLASILIQSLLLGACGGVAAFLAVCGLAYAVKRAQANWSGAIGAAIGTASCELLINGYIAHQGLAAMFGDGPKSDLAQFKQAYAMAVTPLLPLAELVILATGALCRGAATVLFIYTLRARKAAPVFWGVLLVGGTMAAVSVSRAIELIGPESRWMPALLCLPFAIIAVIALRRNHRAWDALPQGHESPLETFLRQHE